MTIEQVHYAVKLKLNRLDSNAFRQLLVPEIDVKINEAQLLYIKNAAAALMDNGLGMESNQRLRDDLRTLVKKDDITVTNLVAALPSDYLFFIRAYASQKKGSCTRNSRVWIVQQDDLNQEDYFSTPSFEWEEVNGYFTSQGIELEVDGTVNSIQLTYVRKPAYAHYADGFGGYILPGVGALSGKQELELPEHTHDNIVDLTVAMISGEMGLPSYPANMNKLKLTQ